MDDRGDTDNPVAAGDLSSHTMGGFVHVLLVVAIIMVLVRLIEGRRVIWAFSLTTRPKDGSPKLSVVALSRPLKGDAMRRDRVRLRDRPVSGCGLAVSDMKGIRSSEEGNDAHLKSLGY